MKRTPLRAGIIGLGYGRAHIAGCKGAGIEVAAVCQRNVAEAEKIAQRYGISRVFGQWEELVALPDLDIVVIAAPPFLHHPIALRAFELGKHVLCEKPLALTVEEARAMVEAARSSGRIGMTDFNWRFTAGMRKAKELVAEGRLGRLFYTSACWYGHRYADGQAPVSWRNDRALAGSGTLGDAGVHLIDLHRWLFGEFTRVSAHTAVAYPEKQTEAGKPADAEDYCAVIGELESGPEVVIQVSRVARGRNLHALEAFGSLGAFEYRCCREGGGARWYLGQLSVAEGKAPFQPVKLKGGLPRGARSDDAMEATGYATIAPLLREMARSIRSGRPSSPSFEDGLKTQSVVTAIQQAADTKSWVDVK